MKFAIESSGEVQSWNLFPRNRNRKKQSGFQFPRIAGFRLFRPASACGLIAIFAMLFGAMETRARRHMSVIDLGDPASEEFHELAYDHSEVITGGLGKKARRLLPKPEPEFTGGKLSFFIKVDPDKQNYVTFKFWGSETAGRTGLDTHVFYLFHNDRIFHYHLWDYVIDLQVPRPFGNNISYGDPPFPGRFFYVTRAIPRHLTEGRESIRLTLQSAGISGPTDRPDPGTQEMHSRAVYRIYSHVDPFFSPSPQEPQGEPPEPKGDREAPDKYADTPLESLLAEKADAEIRKVLDNPVAETGNKVDPLLALGFVYNREWSDFHRNEEALNYIVEIIDFFARGVAAGSIDEPVGYDHRGWTRQEGGSARTLLQVYDALEERGMLDEKINHDGDPDTNPITRGEAYSQYFRKALSHYRYSYSGYAANISYKFVEGIYEINLALKRLDPQSAMPEEEAVKYIYEGMGLLPALTALSRDPPEFDLRKISDKGIEWERKGYSANYGDGVPAGWLRWIENENAKRMLRQKMIQKVKAGSHFLALSSDAEGYRALRNEPFISFRNRPFPNQIAGGRLRQAAVLQDPVSIRRAQLYLKSNRIYNTFEDDYYPPWHKTSVRNLVYRADSYLTVKDFPETEYRLPMEEGQPDSVFSDESRGVIAVKHKDRRIYVGLHDRLDFTAPNYTARIHYTTPAIDRLAVVENETEIKHSGEYWDLPDYLTKKDTRIPTVWKGTDIKWPIAVSPTTPKGKEFDKRLDGDPRGGLGRFYRCRYGDYLFAMNTAHDRTYDLEAPAKFAEDLVSGRIYYRPEGNINLQVPPRTTVVLYLGEDNK